MAEARREPTRFIILGLGNPGSQYALTRHNVGYWVADLLAAEMGGKIASHRAPAEWCQGIWHEKQVVIARPVTFMNLSGIAAQFLLKRFDESLESLLVVHDDLDLNVGIIKMKLLGGHGGHNGVKSISQTLGSNAYGRVRIGIDRPPGRQDPAEYVLGTPRKEERILLQNAAERAVGMIEAYLKEGAQAAMNQFHQKKEPI